MTGNLQVEFYDTGFHTAYMGLTVVKKHRLHIKRHLHTVWYECNFSVLEMTLNFWLS